MADRLGARAGRVGGDRGRGAAADQGDLPAAPWAPARRRDLAGAAAPYETAQARMLYSTALRRAGSERRLELRAALAAFERLGAAGDVAGTAALLDGRGAAPQADGA